MPSVTELRTKALLQAAEAAKVTAAANLVVANAAADNANSAVLLAVRSGGYDNYKLEFGVVKVPTRLRGWSAGNGALPTSFVSIGLESLASAFSTSKAAQTKAQNELDGLTYLIGQVNGILCQDVDFAAPTTTADLNTLLAMLASIEASMAA